MELSKQVTLAIIKPDAVKAGLVDEIIQKVFSVSMFLYLNANVIIGSVMSWRIVKGFKHECPKQLFVHLSY